MELKPLRQLFSLYMVYISLITPINEGCFFCCVTLILQREITIYYIGTNRLAATHGTDNRLAPPRHRVG